MTTTSVKRDMMKHFLGSLMKEFELANVTHLETYHLMEDVMNSLNENEKTCVVSAKLVQFCIAKHTEYFLNMIETGWSDSRIKYLYTFHMLLVLFGVEQYVKELKLIQSVWYFYGAFIKMDGTSEFIFTDIKDDEIRRKSMLYVANFIPPFKRNLPMFAATCDALTSFLKDLGQYNKEWELTIAQAFVIARGRIPDS